MNSTWVEVGPLLQQACQDMNVEDLIQEEKFSLFEAMSAIEIGCIKMDAGATKAPSADDLIAEGKAPVTLTSSQLLAVMDKLLSLEANWQTGDSLAQTVYSCLYMLRPERVVEHLPLSAFCKALRATCIELRASMITAGVCEDEDISIITTDLPVSETNTADTEEKCLAALSLAIDRVNNMKKQSAAAPEAARSGRQEAFSLEQGHFDAVVARLNFRKHLLQAVRKMVKLGKDDLVSAKKLLNSCLVDLEVVKSTAALAAGTEAVGFDRKVNFHSLAPAPPRPYTELTPQQAWVHYERTLQQLVRACDVIQVTTYTQLHSFLEAFNLAGPTTIGRSLLHLQLINRSLDGGTAPAWAPARPMLCAAVGIPTSTPAPADVDTFLEQAQIAVANWVQASLMNRARRRRRLRRTLEDFANLYQHALVADSSPEVVAWLKAEGGWQWFGTDELDPQGPLATWVEMEAARLGAQHLLMGFELELYQPPEYPLIYWYCSFLYDTIFNNLRHLTMLKPRPPAPQPAAPRAGGKPLKPRAKDIRAAAEAREAAAMEAKVEAALDLAYQDMHRGMCQSLMRLTLALRGLGLLPPNTSPFNDEACRFMQRVTAFHLLERPAPLSYHQFQQSTDPAANPPAALLSAASTSLMMVRQNIAMLQSEPRLKPAPHQLEVAKQLERLALQTTVACSVLSKLMASGSAPPPTFDFSTSHHFPTVALKGAAKPLTLVAGAAAADGDVAAAGSNGAVPA